ncbi:MAG TPA: PBP1A family penicillin-binding protein [Candidatus Hydrogenedentes bacterium]|mgnify:FL=1|jgi:penicillin-binding protein 1A|nr:PBP1A family penicillin-binding protein [Candidatus Hydrogenedentota bacterium]MDY0030821.1 PBP1A family penicillin-binding protein [FCB group bacterium]HNV22889.1 PBP1A family penicillin-binding protein [Candidatus Hydrogenedentota bacterium]HNZ17876.1 PBP1A family penicillin-binding protein [Candidatus Hydrogenedentota bacterium]HPA03878.1 PBP1A family penicillin-binding protein [Candidatus Hydrogenedentota bacterium]
MTDEHTEQATELDGLTGALARKPRGCGGIFFMLMLVLAAGWGVGLGMFVWMLDDAKANIQAVDDFRPKVGSRIYSSDGMLLGEYTVEARQLVRLSEIPLHVQKAFIATEDHPFYVHKGVRPLAILSAIKDAVRTGNMRGASTITMQIVRNITEVTGVSTERTMQRKIKEAFVALQLEREFTKDEILELYLNQIFLGGSANGVESAAQQYFGKSCKDVTLAEAATLAGLSRSPNANRPDRYPEAAQQRRDIVLAQMLRHGFITREEYAAAVATNVQDTAISYEERMRRMQEGTGVWRPNRFQAPYFVEEVRQFTREHGYADREELLESGLQIHTTVDMRLQRAAEKALEKKLAEIDEETLKVLTQRGQEDYFVPISGALVCIDNRPGAEGYVRAMVGGRDFDKEKYNTVTQALRQPGSSIKPFVWLAAFQNGLTPSHVEVDERITLYDGLGRPWSPANFTSDFKGPVTLRYALENSINIVSVKLVLRMGMPVVRGVLQRAGITSEINDSHKWTIALGTPDVTVLDLCTAYATIAQGGVLARPTFVETIRDRDEFVRYKSDIHRERTLDADVCYLVTYLMEGVAKYGTGSRSRDLDRPRAGKTGTSNDSRNVWFCGFTPDYTCVVWLGYRDNRSIGQGPDGRWLKSSKEFTGGRLACPVWTEFMVAAHKGLPKRDFAVPDGVVFHNVDKKTGRVGGSFPEAFLKGTRPPAAPAPAEPAPVEEVMEPPSELIPAQEPGEIPLLADI